MLARKRPFLLFAVLLVFLLAGTAQAVPLSSDVLLAEHMEGDSHTGEIFLVFDGVDLAAYSKVKLKMKNSKHMKRGAKFLSEGDAGFNGDIELGALGFDNPVFLQIDTSKKRFKKWVKKAKIKAPKLEMTEEEWLSNKIASKTWKVVLKGEEKEKMIVPFLSFQNPEDGQTLTDQPQASVPEPATMLLLGSGLLGIAALRRRFKK